MGSVVGNQFDEPGASLGMARGVVAARDGAARRLAKPIHLCTNKAELQITLFDATIRLCANGLVGPFAFWLSSDPI